MSKGNYKAIRTDNTDFVELAVRHYIRICRRPPGGRSRHDEPAILPEEQRQWAVDYGQRWHRESCGRQLSIDCERQAESRRLDDGSSARRLSGSDASDPGRRGSKRSEHLRTNGATGMGCFCPTRIAIDNSLNVP